MFANFLPFGPPCCLAWGTHSQSTALVSHIQSQLYTVIALDSFQTRVTSIQRQTWFMGISQIITVTVQIHGCPYYTSAQLPFPPRIHTHTHHTHTHIHTTHARVHTCTCMHTHTHTCTNTHTTCTLSCFLFCFVFWRTSRQYIWPIAIFVSGIYADLVW